MMMLPVDNELTDDCQLKYDVSAAPAYHTLDKEYNLSTLSLSSAMLTINECSCEFIS